MDAAATSAGVGSWDRCPSRTEVVVEGLPHHRQVSLVPLGSAKSSWSQTGLCQRLYLSGEEKITIFLKSSSVISAQSCAFKGSGVGS